MNTLNRIGVAALLLGVWLPGWSAQPAAAAAKPASDAVVSVEPANGGTNGSALKRITLSQKAVERLAIKTGEVAEQGGILTMPYAALLYDQNGQTWAYTNPAPLVYVRRAVTVASVKSGVATLKQGPPPGTVVVVVGAAELHGIESGVGH